MRTWWSGTPRATSSNRKRSNNPICGLLYALGWPKADGQAGFAASPWVLALVYSETVKVKPDKGAIVIVNRTTPAELTAIIDL